jgi:hypothetical protein
MPEVETAPLSTRRTGRRSDHLVGATYFGWLGAGALGQQEAAKSAAAAAMMTSFMISVSWYDLVCSWRRPDSGETSGDVDPCKAKDEQAASLVRKGSCLLFSQMNSKRK